jgi:predicted metal-binding membrane protein
MVGAMMPPLLVLPVRHVSRSTFPRNHASAMTWFGAGYLAIWTMAALVLLPLAEAVQRTGGWGFAFSLAVAAVWSGSPVAQFGRNRCHRLIPISPFGAARVRGCFTQGLVAALPCALVCWPWMVLPMTVPGAMSLVTAAVTILIFLDRLEPPTRCHWRLPPWLRMFDLLVRPQKVVGRL